MSAIHIPAGGEGIVVPHERTDGVVAFLEGSLPARHLIPGHVHERADVWIRVLEGEVGVRVGDEIAVGARGAYLLKPRGIPHAMWNPGDEPNRYIEILTPGEDDLFFRAIFDLPEDASWEEFLAVSARTGLRWFDDWTEELERRFHVRAHRWE